MKNKTLLVVVIVFILVTLLIGIRYHLEEQRTYSLDLYQVEDISSISLKYNDNKVSIVDEKEIDDLHSVLTGIKRVTKEESITAYPANFKEIIEINIKTKENETSKVFVYIKNNKYYLEQSYKGIYKLNEDDYNSIKSYFNSRDEHSFLGKVIEVHFAYMIVEPNEGEEERKSSDKFYIDLENDNDKKYKINTNVKVTYTGDIKETYPAQITTTKIEMIPVFRFAIKFNQEPGSVKRQIIDKKTSKKYDYNVYVYNGSVDIIIDNKTYSLEKTLKEDKITMEEILEKANYDCPKIAVCNDGGSKEYHYDDYTIIKFHTIAGNRDVYIGNKNLHINDIK